MPRCFLCHIFYGTSLFCLLGLLKSFNLLKVDTYFSGSSVDAPLSWQVSGIAGQTNTLSDPPLHVDHGDADYNVIVYRFRVDIWCHYGSAKQFSFFVTQFLTSIETSGPTVGSSIVCQLRLVGICSP
jgi:hypothetical protein